MQVQDHNFGYDRDNSEDSYVILYKQRSETAEIHRFISEKTSDQ